MKTYTVLHLNEEDIREAILKHHSSNDKRFENADIKLSPEFCNLFVQKLAKELMEKLKDNDQFDNSIEWAQNELGL